MAKVQVRNFIYSYQYLYRILIINLGGHNEPPHKKQRTSDDTEAIVSNTPSQSQNISMVKIN